MKAMILAAGLGTRLGPLTEKRPKALVPIVNKAIIHRNIDYLQSHGVRDIIVNAHHHYQQLVEYLAKITDVNLEIRVEPEILGTGGGIKNTQDYWDDEAFIVINTDILTDINLKEAYGYHEKSDALVTLILHDREPYNQILTDNESRIIDIGQKNIPGRLAFTGIHIINPRLLTLIPESGFLDIIELYRHLINEGENILSLRMRNHYWMDIGTIDSYVRSNLDYLKKDLLAISSGSIIADSVKIEPYCVIGRNCRLEEGVEIRRSILWDNVHIKRGRKIEDSIVTSSMEVDRDLKNQIY